MMELPLIGNDEDALLVSDITFAPEQSSPEKPFEIVKEQKPVEEANDPLIFKKGHWTDGEH